MYIRKIEIQNIKALHQVTWEVELERAPGWHVILGDNGAGKSTFLRAIAIALLGPKDGNSLRVNFNDYLTQGQNKAQIELEVYAEKNLDKPKDDIPSTETPLNPIFTIGPYYTPPRDKEKALKVDQHIWSGGGGWFSAGFGPFRRFTGGDPENDRLFKTHPKMAAHLSLFGENVALTETIKWLHELKYRELEILSQGNGPGLPLLKSMIQFINQHELLPHNTKLIDISTQGILFKDGWGAKVNLEDLSDGFRSILSLTLELIRQMERCYGAEGLFLEQPDGRMVVDRPGVVLIDEVDAHLHPTWQRRVGPWFRRFFPKVQFFVATHSPWVCQAAEEGSVFWLPAPDSEKEARFLQGVELERILYGNILEAYGTHVFGSVDRSEHAKEMLDKLARLNLKSLEEDLTTEEEQEQAHLSSIFATEIPRRSRQEQAQRIALLKERMRGGGS